MQVYPRHVPADSAIGLTPVVVPVTNPGSGGGVVTVTQVVGVPFAHSLERVTAQCNAKTGAVTVDVRRGAGASILAAQIAPAAGTDDPAVGTFANGSLETRRGKSTQKWRIIVTIPQSGAIDNGHIVLWFRPFPGHGDVGTIPATT